MLDLLRSDYRPYEQYVITPRFETLEFDEYEYGMCRHIIEDLFITDNHHLFSFVVTPPRYRGVKCRVLVLDHKPADYVYYDAMKFGRFHLLRTYGQTCCIVDAKYPIFYGEVLNVSEVHKRVHVLPNMNVYDPMYLVEGPDEIVLQAGRYERPAKVHEFESKPRNQVEKVKTNPIKLLREKKELVIKSAVSLDRKEKQALRDRFLSQVDEQGGLFSRTTQSVIEGDFNIFILLYLLFRSSDAKIFAGNLTLLFNHLHKGIEPGRVEDLMEEIMKVASACNHWFIHGAATELKKKSAAATAAYSYPSADQPSEGDVVLQTKKQDRQPDEEEPWCMTYFGITSFKAAFVVFGTTIVSYLIKESISSLLPDFFAMSGDEEFNMMSMIKKLAIAIAKRIKGFCIGETKCDDEDDVRSVLLTRGRYKGVTNDGSKLETVNHTFYRSELQRVLELCDKHLDVKKRDYIFYRWFELKESIKVELETLSHYDVATKLRPFNVAFYGGSGIGKSEIVNSLSQMACHLVGIPWRDELRKVFNCSQDGKFDTGPPGIIADYGDLGLNFESWVYDVFMAANDPSPFSLPKADVKDKGNEFVNFIAQFITSNFESFNYELRENSKSVVPFMRRVDLYVEMIVKEAFRAEGSTSIDTAKLFLHTQVVDGVRRLPNAWTFKVSTVHTMDVYDSNNKMTMVWKLSPLMTCDNNLDFYKLYKDKFVAHRMREASTKILSKNLVMCPHCDIPLSCHTSAWCKHRPLTVIKQNGEFVRDTSASILLVFSVLLVTYGALFVHYYTDLLFNRLEAYKVFKAFNRWHSTLSGFYRTACSWGEKLSMYASYCKYKILVDGVLNAAGVKRAFYEQVDKVTRNVPYYYEYIYEKLSSIPKSLLIFVFAITLVSVQVKMLEMFLDYLGHRHGPADLCPKCNEQMWQLSSGVKDMNVNLQQGLPIADKVEKYMLASTYTYALFDTREALHKFKHTKEAISMGVGTGMFIKHRVFVTSKHAVKVGQYIHLFPKGNSNHRVCHDISLTEDMLYYDPLSDCVFIYLPGSAGVSNFFDLVDKLNAEGETLSMWCHASKHVSDVDKLLELSVVKLPSKFVGSGISYFHSARLGVAGDSGSPLLVRTPGGHELYVHKGLVGASCMANLVSRKSFDDAIVKFSQQYYCTDTALNDYIGRKLQRVGKLVVPKDNNDFNNFTLKGEVLASFAQPPSSGKSVPVVHETVLKQSLASHLHGVEYGSPSDKSFDVGGYNRNCYSNRLDKVSDVEVAVDSYLLDSAHRQFEAFIKKQNLPPMDLSPLTDLEVVNGVPGLINAIPMKTSSGPGWGGAKSYHMEEFFTHSNGHTDYTFGPELKKEFDESDAELRAGKFDIYLFKMCTKMDEAKSLEKVKKGDSRVVFCSELVYTCLSRKYIAPILAFLHCYPKVFGCAVGLNAGSKDWEILRDHLTADGQEDISCEDFRAFDVKVVPAIMERVHALFILVAVLFLRYSYADIIALKGLLTAAGQPVLMMRSTVMMFTSSEFSGNVFTAEGNSLINNIYQRMAWNYLVMKKLGIDHKDWRTIPDEWWYDNQIRAFFYGDDVLKSLTKFANKAFTPEEWVDAHLYSGQEVTDGLVKGQPPQTRPFSEANFLKRKWLDCEWFGKKYCMAPLDEDSIYKSLCYNKYSKAVPEKEILEQVVGNAYREFFMHGPKRFYEFCDEIEPLCHRYDLKVGVGRGSAQDFCDSYDAKEFTTWTSGPGSFSMA